MVLEIPKATLKIYPSRAVLQENPKNPGAREDVLSTAFIKDKGSGSNRGHNSRQMRTNVHSSAGVEKDSEGMAWEIWTEQRNFQNHAIITDLEVLTS